jgi:electron transfer flavoprotein alpha subunit
MKSLVLVEYDEKSLKKTSLCAIHAAQKFGGEISVLLAGSQSEKFAKLAAKIEGVKKVLFNPAEIYDFGMAENMGALIAEIGEEYTHILAAATTYGKSILPRAAALLDVAPISDVVEIIDEQTFKRPIYAGNAIATVKSQDPIKVLTIRYTAFAEAISGSNTAAITQLNQIFNHPGARYLGSQLNVSERPDLTSAKVVVAGGRALQSAEKFREILYPLADKLNAGIGASRAAVDAGFVDNDYQVGQTGKIVAPELYIAIGISGAIQHLAGMKDSKIIVAINQDPSAEMMQVADYALEGDLFTLIPELTHKV